jgi:hypothetical protein
MAERKAERGGGRLVAGWALGLALAVLAGCDPVDEDVPQPQSETFRLSGCLGSPGAKTTAIASSDSGVGLRVLYLSADSLRFIVPFDLNCGLRYGFDHALPAPDTLTVTHRVIGGTTAKCECRKDLTVSLKAAPGQAFDKVKALKADGAVYLDFH